ncbi:MAG: hypothetical protein V1802_03470 [Candidatus Aenigmatarchaeota archaeon]
MQYFCFHFPTTRDSALASNVLYNSKVPINVSTLPKKLTCLSDEYCTRAIITKDEYADRVIETLKKCSNISACSNPLCSMSEVEIPKECSGISQDYRIFKVDENTTDETNKPFVKIWKSFKW